MNVGNVNVSDGGFGAASVQSCRAVRIFGINTSDGYVLDRSCRTFCGIEWHDIVVAGAEKIFDSAVMAITAQMDTVHIALKPIAIVKIEGDVFNVEIRYGIKRYGEVCRIFNRQRGQTQIFYVIEQKAKARIIRRIATTDRNRVGRLLFVVKVPDAASNLNVLATRFAFAGIPIDVLEKPRGDTVLIVVYGFVFQHIAVGTRRQSNFGKAGEN